MQSLLQARFDDDGALLLRDSATGSVCKVRRDHPAYMRNALAVARHMRTLLESHDVSAEARDAGGQWTAGGAAHVKAVDELEAVLNKFKKQQPPTKHTHGSRAAALHAKQQELKKAHAEHQLAKYDAWNEVKKEAEAASEKANSHMEEVESLFAETEGTGDSDTEYQDAVTEFDESRSQYDADAPAAERFQTLKEIEITAKKCAKMKPKTAELSDEQAAAKEEHAKLTKEIDAAYKRTEEFGSELDALRKAGDEANIKAFMKKYGEVGGPWDTIINERRQKEARREELGKIIPESITEEQAETNASNFSEIAKHAFNARQQLKAYVQHRREMNAIKNGEPLDVQESMQIETLGDGDPKLVELLEAHDVSGEARDEGGKWTAGPKNTAGQGPHADVTDHERSWSDGMTFRSMMANSPEEVKEGINVVEPYVYMVKDGKAEIQKDLDAVYDFKSNSYRIVQREMPPPDILDRVYIHGTSAQIKDASELKPGRAFGQWGQNEFDAIYLAQKGAHEKGGESGHSLWGKYTHEAKLSEGTKVAKSSAETHGAWKKHPGKSMQEALEAEGYHGVAYFDPRGDVKELALFINRLIPTGSNLAESHDVSGEARDEGGKWTAGGSGPQKSPLAKVKNAITATYDYIHHYGSKSFEKLPRPIQLTVQAVFRVAFKGWSVNQGLAERISIEKGATPEEAAKTRSALMAWDLLAFKPVAFVAPLVDPTGISTAASWVMPPVTGAYLLHSAVLHPLATFRAASGLVKDVAKGAKKFVDEHTQVIESAEQKPDPHMLLADALQKNGYDDWYSALLHAAIAETKDAGRAVEVADKVFAENPKDTSEPADDDPEKLFAKGGE